MPGRGWCGSWLSCSLPHANGGAAGGDHQHAASFAHLDRLVIQIDTHDRISPKRLRLRLHLPDRNLTRLRQLLLVRTGSTADDVADAGEQVHEDVRTQDCLALD